MGRVLQVSPLFRILIVWRDTISKETITFLLMTSFALSFHDEAVLCQKGKGAYLLYGHNELLKIAKNRRCSGQFYFFCLTIIRFDYKASRPLYGRCFSAACFLDDKNVLLRLKRPSENKNAL